MNTSICHLVGAGSFAPDCFVPQKGDLVIACDGGLYPLQDLGILPDLAVGDFDSFLDDPEKLIPSERIVRLPKEKDDTDCLYALRLGLKRGYRRFLLHGALGGTRFSHSLANLALLCFLRQHHGAGVLIDEHAQVYLKGAGTLCFPAQSRGYLSVLAASAQAQVQIDGLKYTFSGTLDAHLPLGTSNEFVGTEGKISVLSGQIFVVAEGERAPEFFFEADKDFTVLDDFYKER